MEEQAYREEQEDFKEYDKNRPALFQAQQEEEQGPFAAKKTVHQ